MTALKTGVSVASVRRPISEARIISEKVMYDESEAVSSE